MTDLSPSEALNLTFADPDSGDTLSIKDYFKRLLKTLYNEGESFSGKRPFGNSGWEGNLGLPLVKAGLVPGRVTTYNEDGNAWEECEITDDHAYDTYVQSLIAAL